MGLFDTLKASGIDALHAGTDKAYEGALSAAGVGPAAQGVGTNAVNAQATPATSQNGTPASPKSPMSFLSHPQDVYSYAVANPVMGILIVLAVGGAVWYAYKKFA